MGRTASDLGRILRRDEKTVKGWLTGKTRVPWWVPELLRLRHMEAQQRHMHMFSEYMAPKLAVVTHTAQLELRRVEKKKPQSVDTRLTDLKQAVG
jgi:hypothetical protein